MPYFVNFSVIWHYHSSSWILVWWMGSDQSKGGPCRLVYICLCMCLCVWPNVVSCSRVSLVLLQSSSGPLLERSNSRQRLHHLGGLAVFMFDDDLSVLTPGHEVQKRAQEDNQRTADADEVAPKESLLVAEQLDVQRMVGETPIDDHGQDDWQDCRQCNKYNYRYTGCPNLLVTIFDILVCFLLCGSFFPIQIHFTEYRKTVNYWFNGMDNKPILI